MSALHYELLNNGNDWPTVSPLVPGARSADSRQRKVHESVLRVQPAAYKGITLPSSSSTRQHHARAAVYPRDATIASCDYRSL